MSRTNVRLKPISDGIFLMCKINKGIIDFYEAATATQ